MVGLRPEEPGPRSTRHPRARSTPTDAFALQRCQLAQASSRSRTVASSSTPIVTATGDVISTEKEVVAIPLEPESVAAAFPNDILGRITSEFAKTDGYPLGKGTPGPTTTRAASSRRASSFSPPSRGSARSKVAGQGASLRS